MTKKDQKVKADIIGPNAQSGRFPAMSAMARAPNPVEGWSSRTLQTMHVPLAVIDSLRIVESKICGLDPQIEDST